VFFEIEVASEVQIKSLINLFQGQDHFFECTNGAINGGIPQADAELSRLVHSVLLFILTASHLSRI
jgi:hypothetical protein